MQPLLLHSTPIPRLSITFYSTPLLGVANAASPTLYHSYLSLIHHILSCSTASHCYCRLSYSIPLPAIANAPHPTALHCQPSLMQSLPLHSTPISRLFITSYFNTSLSPQRTCASSKHCDACCSSFSRPSAHSPDHSLHADMQI